MNHGADDVAGELVGALRDLLAKRLTGDPTLLGWWDHERTTWTELADMGLFGICLPEASGGIGLGFADTARAFEALGEARTAGPLVWTQLAAFADPSYLAGTRLITGVDLTAVAPGDPVLVSYLSVADAVLVLSVDGVSLVPVAGVDASLAGTPFDPATPLSVVHGWGEGERLGDVALAERLRRRGMLLTAALLVGVSQTAIHTAVEYAQGRHQFGRPIGSFQALKHLLADSYTRTNLARAAVYAAAELEEAHPEGPMFDLHAAKLLAGRAADKNSRTAVQVYGGMGFAAETQPHLLLKRSWFLEHEFGTVADHALAIGDSLAGASA
jgi:alkylation response protein AidB-like acyl-CoA dehydrogenase